MSKIIRYIGFALLAAAFILSCIGDQTNNIASQICLWTAILILSIQSGFNFYKNEKNKYKNEEMVDKGRESNYYKLSYRRRALRSAIVSAAFLAIAIVVTVFNLRIAFLAWVCFAAFALQTIAEIVLWIIHKEKK